MFQSFEHWLKIILLKLAVLSQLLCNQQRTIRFLWNTLTWMALFSSLAAHRIISWHATRENQSFTLNGELKSSKSILFGYTSLHVPTEVIPCSEICQYWKILTAWWCPFWKENRCQSIFPVSINLAGITKGQFLS